MPAILVTCALIVQNGSVLITQRSETMPLPLLWEFPGGKVDAAETEKQCVAREIKEELNLEIKPLQRLTPVQHFNGSKTILLIPFICSLLSGKLTLAEHKDYRWAKPEELRGFTWCPADVPVVEEYLKMCGCADVQIVDE